MGADIASLQAEIASLKEQLVTKDNETMTEEAKKAGEQIMCADKLVQQRYTESDEKVAKLVADIDDLKKMAEPLPAPVVKPPVSQPVGKIETKPEPTGPKPSSKLLR